MTQMAENPKLESHPVEKSEDIPFKAQYQKRFEEAVADAQYMLIYASSKCPKDINKSTAQKLINARISVENGKKLSTDEEVAFWLAYQDIWKLIQPATAESIKANRATAGASTSKSHTTLIRYIGFTAVVLLILLITQIYWVVGNQLTTQLTDLLDKESKTSLQLIENQKELSEIELRYKQDEKDAGNSVGDFYNSPEWERDTLEVRTLEITLGKDLETFQSQLARTAAILKKWSLPWDWLIDEDSIQVSKYASEIKSIEDAIGVIDGGEIIDSSGEKTAQEQNALRESLISEKRAEWNFLWQEYSGLDTNDPIIQTQLSNYDQIALNNKYNELVGLLTELESKKAANQANIDQTNQEITNAPTDGSVNIDELNTTLSTLETETAEIQNSIDEVNSQLLPVQADLDTIINLQANLDYIAARRTELQNQMLTLQTEIESLISQQVSAEQIVIQRNIEREVLNSQKNNLILQEQAEKELEKSSQAQLAAQFVLVILQSYTLPLLFGLLGASTFVLRTLSRQIETVTYSEEVGTHLSRISLGALAGIIVGWFSFLIDTSTFVGSVSPLAIAFLVGYNIELFFSLMDRALFSITDRLQRPSPTQEEEPKTIPEDPPASLAKQPTSSTETPTTEESAS